MKTSRFALAIRIIKIFGEKDSNLSHLSGGNDEAICVPSRVSSVSGSFEARIGLIAL